MLILTIFNCLDVIFNLTCEKLKDDKIVESLYEASKIYIKRRGIFDFAIIYS